MSVRPTPVIYRPKAGSPVPEGGFVVRIVRLADGKCWAPTGPGTADWVDAPGEPWPMKLREDLHRTWELAVPERLWEDDTIFFRAIYPADACDPAADDPLDWDVYSSGETPGYVGRMSSFRR